MRKSTALRDALRIIDILTGTTGAFFGNGCAMVIELKGHSHHVIAEMMKKGRGNGAVHAARHRHDDTVIGRMATQAQRIAGQVQSGQEIIDGRRRAAGRKFSHLRLQRGQGPEQTVNRRRGL